MRIVAGWNDRVLRTYESIEDVHCTLTDVFSETRIVLDEMRRQLETGLLTSVKTGRTQNSSPSQRFLRIEAYRHVRHLQNRPSTHRL